MDVLAHVVALLPVPILLLAGGAKVAATADMRERAAHLGYSLEAFRAVGALELLAVAGLVAGQFWSPLAVVTSGAVVVLMVGAVVSHRRAGDPVATALPAVVVGLLAAASVVLTVAVG